MMKMMMSTRLMVVMMMTNLWRPCSAARLSHGTRAVMGSRSQPNIKSFQYQLNFILACHRAAGYYVFKAKCSFSGLSVLILNLIL